MIGELLKTYDEQRANFSPSDEVYVIVWQIDAFVERLRELEAELEVCREKERLEWERSRDD